MVRSLQHQHDDPVIIPQRYREGIDDALHPQTRPSHINAVFADARPAHAHFIDERQHRGAEGHVIAQVLALQHPLAAFEKKPPQRC